jgi:hypothetical protein
MLVTAPGTGRLPALLNTLADNLPMRTYNE